MTLQNDLEKIDAALDAAGRVLEQFTPGEIASRLKVGDDPVTAADIAVDRVLKEILPVPGEGWLSEETADDPDRLARRRVWVVDPIDGTREFIEGLPEWCVSIGLVVDGEAVAGGIFNPATDERILGGVGAPPVYRGTRPKSDSPSLSEGTVLASRSEVRRGEWDGFESRVTIVPMGSVAFKLALVAAGRADATWTLVPKREWDVAAGAALVAASGGLVARSDARPLTFNNEATLLPGFLAARPEIADDVLDLLGGLPVPDDVLRT